MKKLMLLLLVLLIFVTSFETTWALTADEVVEPPSSILIDPLTNFFNGNEEYCVLDTLNENTPDVSEMFYEDNIDAFLAGDWISILDYIREKGWFVCISEDSDAEAKVRSSSNVEVKIKEYTFIGNLTDTSNVATVEVAYKVSGRYVVDTELHEITKAYDPTFTWIVNGFESYIDFGNGVRFEDGYTNTDPIIEQCVSKVLNNNTTAYFYIKFRFEPVWSENFVPFYPVFGPYNHALNVGI